MAAHGYQTQVAQDGPTALKIAAEFQPMVAVLDIGLPVMDGYEVAKRLLTLSGLEQVRLIALTGYGQEEDWRRSRQAGHHLVKPVDVHKMLNLLAKDCVAKFGPRATEFRSTAVAL